MRFTKTGKNIVGIMIALCMASSLSGCAYSNVDEYLEQLGMKDPQDNSSQHASSEISVLSNEAGTEESEAMAKSDNSSSDISDSSNAASEKSDSVDGEKTSDKQIIDSTNGNVTDADKLFAEYYKQLKESDIDEEMKQARIDAGLTDENLALLKSQQEGLYAYDRLTEAGKTLYVEMLSIIQNMAENVLVSTTSSEAIDLVFDYLLADHPELFYVDGYKYTNYSVDDVVTKVGFSGSYIYNEKEVKRRQDKINRAVNECLSGAPSNGDDYYTIKYIYEYLIKNTEYGIDVEDNQNICSVFIDRKSVCNGYAKAAQYLLNKLDIKCIVVTGTVNTKKARNVSHAWNLVQCNGAFYYMDVTWGDSSYQVGNGESADATRIPDVNYDYLNVTTDEILKSHTISDTLYMPVCDSMKDNYYVREDEYFKAAELTLVGELFERRYNDGSENVVIKCADKSVYDQFFNELITQRKVFDYLQGENSSVSYTTFADTNTIIFWI